MVKVEKIEYIEYRNVLKISIKLLWIMHISLILKNINDSNTYKLNFSDKNFILNILMKFNEKKLGYDVYISIFNILNIKKYISLNKIMNIPVEILENNNLSNLLELSSIEDNINFIYNNIKIEKPIDIIIPIYNGFQHLANLFKSIFNNTNLDYRLIIINDCSTDKNVYDYLEKLSNNQYTHCKEIIIINNETNLGFIKSVNKGATYTNNHFILLNTDVIVPKDWINRIIYPIMNKDNIASVTPFTNSGTICSFPIFCQDNELFLNLDVQNIDNQFKKNPEYISYKEIPTAVGFCMAINKEIFNEIGDLDTIFGKGYGEENDWCMRASKKGYKHLIAGNLFVYHNHGGSFIPEEKKILLEKNLAILSQRYPYYNDLIQNYVQRDELKFIRNYLMIKLLSEEIKLEVDLIFTHNLEGGTELYLQNYIKNNIDKKLYIVIRALNLYGTFNYSINLKYQNINIEFIVYNLYELISLFEFLKIEEIKNIIVNHLIGFDVKLIIPFILNIKNRYNSNIRFKVHDFFSICKSHNLLYKNKYFCNLPEDINICKECLKDSNIVLYRKYFEILLLNSEIITFSNSSKDIILKVYKSINPNNIIVKPHKVDWINRKAKKSISKKNLHVGVLGVMAEHKGYNIIKELLNLIKNDNIILYSLGECNLNNSKLIKTGGYNHNNLVDKVENYDIDIFIIPSIWPETFSYTTEEIILMDKPIIVFNLGAPAERVAHYDKGYIVNEISAEGIYKELLKFYKNNKE